MDWRKTSYSTILVAVIFGIIYGLVLWLGFHGKFLPIEQVAGFKIPFLVSRYYDFALICLWPIIMTPLISSKDDYSVLGFVGMFFSFLAIGGSLTWFSYTGNIGRLYLAIVFIIIAWILTEALLFVEETNNNPKTNRKKIIKASLYVYIFDGLGVGLIFLFSKGLLIGIIFGLLVTICLTILTLINNLVFKSLIREIIKSDKSKEIVKYYN